MKKTGIIVVAVMLGFATFWQACNFGSDPGYKKTETGVMYLIHTPENSDTNRVSIGKWVSIDMNYGTEDTIIFDSQNAPRELMFQIQESVYPGDIFEALSLFVKGDSASFKLNAEQFFTKTAGQATLPDFLKEVEMLTFNVKIREVQTEEEMRIGEQAKMEVLQEAEQNLIVDFVKENNIQATPNASGIYYMETKQGSGANPVKGNWLSVHYTVYKLGNDKLFSTLDRANEPVDFELGNRFENEGFQEVIEMMKEGGKAEAIVPSAKAFGAQGAGDVVPPYQSLYYEIELVKIMSAEEWEVKQAEKNAVAQANKQKMQAAEKSVIANYLSDNNLVPTAELPTGLVYVEQEKGTGPQPKEGDKVRLHYTGKLLDGSIFDSSVDKGTPFEFSIGRGMVIKGWDTGVPLMHVGSKGILVIPFEQAYGERGAGDRIPPNSTLVFELELLEIVTE